MSASIVAIPSCARVGVLYLFLAVINAFSTPAGAGALIQDDSECFYSRKDRDMPVVNLLVMRAAYNKDKSPYYDYVAAATIRRLIEKGCSVDIYGPGGVTALQIAVQQNLPILVGALMRNGADPALKAKSQMEEFRGLNAFELSDENINRTFGAPVTLEVRGVLHGRER